MEDCIHYWHTSCLFKKSATVERLENANGDPVGYDVVKGERCKYDKCPYKEWVGTNNQNKSNEMKTTDLETSKLLQELNYDGKFSKIWSCEGCPSAVDYNLGLSNKLIYNYDLKSPRLDDVAYWLMEKYDMGIYPYNISQTSTSLYMEGDYKLQKSRWMMHDAPDLTTSIFPSYDAALAAAIIRALQIIKRSKS